MSQAGNNYELLYKIIIIGNAGVGKSNILSRYVKDEFREKSKSTIGVELGTKYLTVKGCGAKVQIWDTAGQEKYRSITSSYYKGSHGCFIVYDITNENSFESIDRWFEQIKRDGGKDVSVIIVGNKCDLENERVISKEKGEEKAKTLKCPFFETSALFKINIDDIFDEMVNNIYDTTGGVKKDDSVEVIKENVKGISLEPHEPPKKQCC